MEVAQLETGRPGGGNEFIEMALGARVQRGKWTRLRN